MQLIDVILIAMQVVGPADGTSYVTDYYSPRYVQRSVDNETVILGF
jgi:hypothetical protein